MQTEFLYLSLASFLFGVTQKIADNHHDEGMYFFRHSSIAFGILCGAFGFFLISYSPILQAVYLGPLLYWIYRRKIDCKQHMIAAFLMFMGIIYTLEFLSSSLLPSVGIFLGYTVFDVIKKHTVKHRWFFKRHIHFHFIHFLYATGIGSIYGYSPLVFNLLGIYVGGKFDKKSRKGIVKVNPQTINAKGER